jgi:hypothetical protein
MEGKRGKKVNKGVREREGEEREKRGIKGYWGERRKERNGGK